MNRGQVGERPHIRLTLLFLLWMTGCTRHGHPSVPVQLKVITNPPTEVTVIPPPGSGRATAVLGRTPLDASSGAFVGDTVRLTNVAEGIKFDEVIEYGQPNDLKLISKVFRKGGKKPQVPTGAPFLRRRVNSATRSRKGKRTDKPCVHRIMPSTHSQSG